jgi:hypothetical protein
MNTRNVIGRKIVAVRQGRAWYDERLLHQMEVYEIELDNGVLLRPIALEGSPEHYADVIVVRPKRVNQQQRIKS